MAGFIGKKRKDYSARICPPGEERDAAVGEERRIRESEREEKQAQGTRK